MNYNEMMRLIKPYVNFKHDLRRNLKSTLSAIEKRRITRNFNIIRPLLARNNKVYRPRGKNAANNLKMAQQFGQHSEFSKNIKVALIPTDGEKGARVIVKGNKVILKQRGIIQTSIIFDQIKLAQDPKKHVNELIKESDATRFHIRAGEFAISTAESRNTVARVVAQLTEMYKIGGSAYRTSGTGRWSNHFSNWMIGLTASEFINQKEFDNFNKKKFPTKKQRKAKIRATKKKSRKRIKRKSK